MTRGPRRLGVLAALLAPVLVLGAACTGSSSPSSSPDPSAGDSLSSPSGAAPARAEPAPRPDNKACYALSYDEAVAPTTSSKSVPCGDEHTAMTYAVGTLDLAVDGHLLAVDSDRAQAQVARACPTAFARFVGGSVEARRLSMLRAVWFTPTVEESDTGADWYRCDAIALAGPSSLAPLTGRLAGVLDRPGARERYAMCGTAEPGTDGFERVVCSADHSWKALRTVTFTARDYPGVQRVRSAGQGPCKAAGRDAADDSLNFQWGYEWPTREQWRNGQTYGICWAPA